MKQEKKSLAPVAALALFGVFALGILASLLTGAGAYRRITQNNQKAQQQRSAAQYFSMRVHQSPHPDSIRVGDFGGDCLEIWEQIDGEAYLTRVYCCDGWLMELFSTAEGQFSPADGEKILPLDSLSIALQEDLLILSYPGADGTPMQLYLSLVKGGSGA